MSKGTIIRKSLDDIMRERLTRDQKAMLDNLPADEDIDTSDIPEWTQEMFDNAQVVSPGPKKSIHLRMDEDIFEFFKKRGPGHLTKMHAVLRSYVDAKNRDTDEPTDAVEAAE